MASNDPLRSRQPNVEDDRAARELLSRWMTLARMEWEYIHAVLLDCRGNVSAAARRLGLPRRSLQRKLQRIPPR